ncbi:hypothetical protein J1614_009013, partial [Plenodomus biglobosus]
MWKFNVPRLRKTSSIAAVRNHGSNYTRWYSSSVSLPIAEHDFLRALQKVLYARWNPESKAPLGFAISGGVDSMALATLYARARKNDSNLPLAHGFIVDHKARPESAEETKWVAEQLRQKLDMESTILQLEWPKDLHPSDLRRFETEARRLRYQTLGVACRNRGITSIMVAHHADDQAETVLMRLSNNRLRSGLQAMQSVEWIPECEGIHGVYHSGNPLRLHNNSLMVEHGGMQILRPLLGFKKAQLIASCKDDGMPWAEDTTNRVQTLTTRNAIRHIYQNHKLPEALGVDNLVEVSSHMQKRVESHKAYAAKLFDQCLIKLNIQTGSALVRFPPFSALLDRAIETDSDRNEASNNAYFLIKRVAELISPRPSAPLDTLAATISNIYPELVEPDSATSPSKNFCVFGIWWRASDEMSPIPSKAEADFDPARPHPRQWLLMRQPPSTREQKTEAHELKYSLPSTNRHEPSKGQWQLFDGRFWIRLENLTSDTLSLRLFTANDRRLIAAAEQTADETKKGNTNPHSSKHKTAHRPQRHRCLSAALNLIKPSTLHYTLPALFRKHPTTGAETLVGFPTLDVHARGIGAPRDLCRWNVRYKKIDVGSRELEDLIVPRLSRHELDVQGGRDRGARAQRQGGLGGRPR